MPRKTAKQKNGGLSAIDLDPAMLLHAEFPLPVEGDILPAKTAIKKKRAKAVTKSMILGEEGPRKKTAAKPKKPRKPKPPTLYRPDEHGYTFQPQHPFLGHANLVDIYQYDAAFGVKRCANVFIIFRSHFLRNFKANDETKTIPQKVLSQIAGMEWQKLTAEQRVPYWNAYWEVKRNYHAMFPYYKYLPRTGHVKELYQASKKENQRLQREAKAAIRLAEKEAENEAKRAMGIKVPKLRAPRKKKVTPVEEQAIDLGPIPFPQQSDFASTFAPSLSNLSTASSTAVGSNASTSPASTTPLSNSSPVAPNPIALPTIPAVPLPIPALQPLHPTVKPTTKNSKNKKQQPSMFGPTVSPHIPKLAPPTINAWAASAQIHAQEQAPAFVSCKKKKQLDNTNWTPIPTIQQPTPVPEPFQYVEPNGQISTQWYPPPPAPQEAQEFDGWLPGDPFFPTEEMMAQAQQNALLGQMGISSGQSLNHEQFLQQQFPPHLFPASAMPYVPAVDNFGKPLPTDMFGNVMYPRYDASYDLNALTVAPPSPPTVYDPAWQGYAQQQQQYVYTPPQSEHNTPPAAYDANTYEPQPIYLTPMPVCPVPGAHAAAFPSPPSSPVRESTYNAAPVPAPAPSPTRTPEVSRPTFNANPMIQQGARQRRGAAVALQIGSPPIVPLDGPVGSPTPTEFETREYEAVDNSGLSADEALLPPRPVEDWEHTPLPPYTYNCSPEEEAKLPHHLRRDWQPAMDPHVLQYPLKQPPAFWVGPQAKPQHNVSVRKRQQEVMLENVHIVAHRARIVADLLAQRADFLVKREEKSRYQAAKAAAAALLPPPPSPLPTKRVRKAKPANPNMEAMLTSFQATVAAEEIVVGGRQRKKVQGPRHAAGTFTLPVEPEAIPLPEPLEPKMYAAMGPPPRRLSQIFERRGSRTYSTRSSRGSIAPLPAGTSSDMMDYVDQAPTLFANGRNAFNRLSIGRVTRGSKRRASKDGGRSRQPSLVEDLVNNNMDTDADTQWFDYGAYERGYGMLPEIEEQTSSDEDMWETHGTMTVAPETTKLYQSASRTGNWRGHQEQGTINPMQAFLHSPVLSIGSPSVTSRSARGSVSGRSRPVKALPKRA